MAHQNLMFDTLHPHDNAQASYRVLLNNSVYDVNFVENMQYTNNASSSFSNNWNLPESNSPSGYAPSNQPRTMLSNPHHHTQASTFVQDCFPSYPPSSPSYTLSEPSRLRTEYQSSHARLAPNHRSRSEDDVYSMLSPTLSDIHHNQLTMAIPGNSTRGRNTAWECGHRQMQGMGADITSEVFAWPPQPGDDQAFTLDCSWSDPMSSCMSSPDVHLPTSSSEYNFPIEPIQSRSAVAYALRQVSPASSTSSPSASRRSSVEISSATGKVCSHCHATSTPLWRREPTTLKPLCNACGLYLQQRNKHRPQELIDADAADDSDISDGDTSGPECSHCHTHHTSVWRRSKTGAQLCNACGVYARLRGRDRPLSLKRNKIKPRSKHTPTTSPRNI